MPNTASAEKRMRQGQKRNDRNRAAKSRVKTLTRHLLETIEAGHQEESLAALARAQSALDKAAKRGILHRNTASRTKARLAHRVHVAFAPTTTEQAA
jgi:small subunit ribosomal protein S20